MGINRNKWEQYEANWAREGFTRKDGRPYEIPSRLIKAGECKCGSLLIEHNEQNTCEVLRKAKRNKRIENVNY